MREFLAVRVLFNAGYTPWHAEPFGCRVAHGQVARSLLLPMQKIFNSTILPMCDLALIVLPVAAAGYSLIYLLFGGGLGGAVVIFIVAKLLGK